MKAGALVLALLAACSTTGPPDLARSNDRQEKRYRVDRDVAFHAMVRALQKEGYEITVADPIRLRIEAKAGDRVAILQGIEGGGGILIRVGMAHAEPSDFRRLWRRLDQEVKR